MPFIDHIIPFGDESVNLAVENYKTEFKKCAFTCENTEEKRAI